MVQLGAGLFTSGQWADALVPFEVFLAYLRRTEASEYRITHALQNVVNCYWRLGRETEALVIERDILSRQRRLFGPGDEDTVVCAANHTRELIKMGCYDEAISILRDIIPAALKKFGPKHDLMLRLNMRLGDALVNRGGHDRSEGMSLLHDTGLKAMDVLGHAHPVTRSLEKLMWDALPVPRFQVGARVECCFRGAEFLKGTVVQHHYNGGEWDFGVFAPYQVELDNGGLVFALEDDDDCIRAAAPESSDEPVAAPNTSDGDA